MGVLDLGSRPDDPLISELVKLNATSVRLANAISATVSRNALPVRHVSEYMALGTHASDAFVRHVSNLGRKSANELHQLMHAAEVQRRKDDAPSSLDANEIRREVCRRLGGVTLAQAIAETVLPTRLSKAIYEAGLAEQRLAEVVENYDHTHLVLARLPNVGRTTIAAGRRVLGDIVRAQLQGQGFGQETALRAECLVFRSALLDDSALGDVANAAARRTRVGEMACASSDDANAPSVEPTVTELIEHALDRLDARSSLVVRRRFGLTGEAQTLEELGRSLNVTRERIRQIEAKALQRMRTWSHQKLANAITRDGHNYWSNLTGGKGYLVASGAHRGRNVLPRHFLLALELCEMEVEAWLDAHAQPYGSGWIDPDWSAAQLADVGTQLKLHLDARPTPCQLSEFESDHPASWVRAAASFADCSVFGTYINDGRLTRRLQRALSLHAVLGTSGESMHVVRLLREYLKRCPSDQCTTRDCEIVMQALPHLFLEISEGRWATLGPIGELPAPATRSTKRGTPRHEQRSDADSVTAAEGTICRSIEAELRKRGPSRISELIDRAGIYLPDGRSVNSVGPILLTRKDLFARPLPGIYALHDQIPSPSELLAAPPPYLLQEDQARLYALARRSGEPWGTYPLWSRETEYLWCVWACMHADSALLESLLAVAHIDGWPTHEDRNAWRKLAESRGRFQLHFQHNPEALVLPDLNRVLAGCLYVRQHGYLSWVSANRILLRRVDEQLGGGLLATLVALQVLQADAEHWQLRHSPGPRANDVLMLLEDACGLGLDLSWRSGLGEQLKGLTAKTQPRHCWVTTDIIRTLFLGSPAVPHSPVETSPLEQLLAENTRVRKSASREATFVSLPNADAAS